MSTLSRMSAVLLVVLSVVATQVPTALAQDASPEPAPVVLAPDATVDGSNLAEWSARSWQWYFSVPSAINPYNDSTGESCGLGQYGSVFILASAIGDVERTCTVPSSMALFVPIAGAECSTVEDPPFFGTDETSLRQCAKDAVDHAASVLDMDAMALVVDGQPVPDLTGYRAITSMFQLNLPVGNELGAPAGVAYSAADGYAALIGPLSAGDHQIEISVPEVQGAYTITYRISVQSGDSTDGESAATPTSAEGTPGSTGAFDAVVDIADRDVHVACVGNGSPAIVFEPGGPDSGGGTAAVADVGPFVADALGVRFCSYDRAGSGQSAPDPMGIRTFKESASDLISVLAIPELGCPCVVVGESLGGSISLVALSTDPSNIAGLVLLDPPYPGYWDDFSALAPPESLEAGLADDSYFRGENEESVDVIAGFQQVTAPAEQLSIPIIVVAHGAGVPPPCNWDPPCSADYPVDDFEAAWQAGERQLAEALGGRLIVAENTGHSIANENPDLVIRLVAEVLAAVRDPATWATPVATPLGADRADPAWIVRSPTRDPSEGCRSRLGVPHGSATI